MCVLVARVTALVLVALSMQAFAATASAGTRGHCSLQGPRWDLYGIHDGSHRTGTKYRIDYENLTCRKSRRFVRRIFRTIPAKPKGVIDGPAGYMCRGTWSGDHRNRMFSGTCQAPGPNPSQPWVDARRFTWGPTFPT